MTSRREVIAALATAVAVVPAVPALAANPPSVWAAAMQDLETKRAAETAYDRAIWTPAYEGSRASGPPIPDSVDAEISRLTDIRIDAEYALIATPAPTLSAVIWKIEYARKRWEDFETWPEEWWDAVMADLRRFATIPLRT